MKSHTLSKRLYTTIFKVSLLAIALAFIAAEWMYEDIEETILYIEFAAERDYFLQRITHPDIQQWQTARLNAIFLGEQQPKDILPDLVKQLSAPYAAEVNTPTGAYLVSVEAIEWPKGAFYLIQDISTLEHREFVGQTILLGLALLILTFTLVLSRFIAQRLTVPFIKLTSEIQNTNPGKSMRRLATDYREIEYGAIAEAFNRFLSELEQYVRRENAFVNLASHELRTPLAVISGALDVIEKRQQASQADRKTLLRIRRATSEMQADVEILLKLARGPRDSEAMPVLDLAEVIRQSVVDLFAERQDWADRLSMRVPDYSRQTFADAALVRILMRNLVINALKHTSGRIWIVLDEKGIQVIDEGPGLPANLQQQINNATDKPLPELVAGPMGFGLLIIQLVCARLGWRLRVIPVATGGTQMMVDIPRS